MSDTAPAPSFHEYPKVMVHPNYKPATPGTSPDERKGLPGKIGTPVYMPPVTVTDKQQEDYHRDRMGYTVLSNGNAAAFMAAHAVPEGAEPSVGFEEFPKMVRSKVLILERVVNNEAEEEAALREIAEAEVAHAKAEAEEAARLAAEAGRPSENERVERLEKDMGDIKAMLELLLEEKRTPRRRGSE